MEHIVLDLSEHALIIGVKLIVLRGNHDGIDALGFTFVGILHGDLTFRVRTQIGHLLPFLTNLSQGLHQTVGKVERNRHIVFGLVRGITEHHSLIAGALTLLVFTGNALVDIIALLVDGREHTARIAVELILRLRVANLVDGLARNGLQVDVF